MQTQVLVSVEFKLRLWESLVFCCILVSTLEKPTGVEFYLRYQM
jgi:hypothetical protein